MRQPKIGLGELKAYAENVARRQFGDSYRGYSLMGILFGSCETTIQAYMPNSPLHPKDIIVYIVDIKEGDSLAGIAQVVQRAITNLIEMIDAAYDCPEEAERLD